MSEQTRIITEIAFRDRLMERTAHLLGQEIRSMMGPGRSGAIASVYASHYLGVPWLPATGPVPRGLRPLLVIDTATATGRTLPKIMKRHSAEMSIALFDEPPRVRFWYETLGDAP